MTYLEELDVEPEVLDLMKDLEATKPLMQVLAYLEEEQKKREEEKQETEEKIDTFAEENEKVFVKSLYNW